MSSRRVKALEKENARLRAELAERDRRIAELTAKLDTALHRIAELEDTVRDLRSRLGQNSSNSSRPPSSDPPGTPPRTRKRPSGKRRGGQPGHKGHRRPLVPPAKVDVVVPVKPAKCGHCRGPLFGEDPDPRHHQIIEIPRPKPHVTDYLLHTLLCGRCGETTKAEIPSGVPSGTFGPRLQALVALYRGVYHLSVRMVKVVLEDQFGVPISEGSIIACQKIVGEALANPVEEIHDYVVAQPVKHADETGWRVFGKKAWLWVATVPLATVFLIHRSRGAQAARELLRTILGVLVSDRWGGYSYWPVRLRQICWAHLKRAFEGFVDRGGEGKRIGEALLLEVERLFRFWHRVRDGTLKRSSFRVYMGQVRRRTEALLAEGAACNDRKVAGRCRKILSLAPALWTFVRVDGVEPTNNAAERVIRPFVLWRKGSFGTQSVAGSLFAARVMTAATTLRQQGRNVSDYLEAVCRAALDHSTPPSLLPGATTQTAKRAA